MMDKLGLLSLQVPILASSTESADGSSSLFIAAAEALPTRYVSPHPEAAAAAAGVGAGEHAQRGGGVTATGSGSSSFAAADASSSCSSCFWDDNSSSNDSSKGGCGAAAAAGIDYWTACSETASAPKLEAKKGVASPCLRVSDEQQGPERQATERQATNSETQRVREGKAESECYTAAGSGLAVAVAGQSEGAESWESLTTRREDKFRQNRSMHDACVAVAAAAVEGCSMKETHASRNYSGTPATQNGVVLRSAAHAAAAKDATTETATTAPEASVLEAAISKAGKGAVEDSPVLQAAVAGVGSSSKVKGGSTDDSVCGTGTPTTRFSTEQEEDGVAPPASSHREAALTDAAATSGTAAEEGEDSCRSDVTMRARSPRYGRPPSSVDLRFGGAGAAAAATENRDLEDPDEKPHEQDGETRTLSWHHEGQGEERNAGENQIRRQHFCTEGASLQDGDPFLRDGGTVGDLLAAAAAVVEQQVHALSVAGGAPASQKGRARSEEARVAVACTPADESAERTISALASVALPNNAAACFDDMDVLCGLSATGPGAAGRSSAGLPACLQSEQLAPGTLANETALSLTFALETTLLEAGQEAGILPSSSTSTSSTSSEERSLALAETREASEGSSVQAQSSKKQTMSSERVAASQALHEAGAKGSAQATGGGGGRVVGTRGAGGAVQQQTNGSGGYAADLPEDPELVECLKGLLTALPRKKDAEARWLLSGEMRFVRPYALQIVDVWKIHLGEAGRTALKKDISERTQADATLKKRVLAISKLKMATLEELVQIAELADLLVRTLQIANMYEAERQVASVTRQSASRRALSAAVTAVASQSPSASAHNNSYYGGSNTNDASATAGGSSSHSASVGVHGSGVGGPAGSGRNASTSAQTSVSTRQNTSSYSPSRASVAASVSPPADSSPRGGHRPDTLSPCSRSACPTSAALSPRAGGGGAGGSTAADENCTLSDELTHFCQNSPPAAEGSCSSNNSSSPTPLYDSLENSACARPAGLSAAASALAERSGGTRACSPRASSEVRYHFLGMPESPEGANNSVQHLQHQQLQQQLVQQPQLHHVQQQHQQERGHEQPFCGSSDEEARRSEAEVTLVAQELQETLNILQQGSARPHRGREALPSSATTKASSSRSEAMSPSKEWTERTDETGVAELQQGSTKKKMMLPQPRRSQPTGNCVEKDEDAIRAAELLAAFADLRSAMASGSHPQLQIATDISSSSTMAHEELLNFTLEAAAAGVAASPRARALVAALSDNHRFARILELSGFACFDREDGSSGGVRRRPQDQEMMTLLRLAALTGDEAAVTGLAGRLTCVTSQGSTSNSSSSSEAEGAAVQELDGEVGPADHQTVRRKRVRRSAKSAVRNGNRNRSAASSREIRLDENDTLLLQQLHQQLQQLQQQQMLQARESAGEDLSAQLAGEVQACMNALEAEAAAGKGDFLSHGSEKPYCKRKRSCQTTAEDKPQGHDPMQDEETEEEDSSQTRAKGRAVSEIPDAAALLQSVDCNYGRHSSLGRPAAADCAEGSSGAGTSAAGGVQSDTGCKGTCPREDDNDRHAKIGGVRGNAPFNTEKEASNGGVTEAKTGSKGAAVRPPRRKDEEEENVGVNGSIRCSEERTAAADAPDERTTDGTSRSTATRPAARSDVEVEIRSTATSRSVSRGGSYRCNLAVDGFPGTCAENSTSCNRGRNGVRQGRENFWAAAHYTTRRSAAAAAGASAGEGGDSGFSDAVKCGGSNGGSRAAARGVTHGESEGKVALTEKNETQAGSVGGPGDSVAEQCAREARQLLERAVKVNDALGFVPASCRLTVSGTTREQETSSSGSSSGTGTRAKRAREQVSTGEWDTGAFLQVLATACLMYLRQ